MRATLLDSSIYISGFRRGAPTYMNRFPADMTLWLSAVVLEELYAGVRESDRNVVQQLEQDFYRLGRILVPDLSDWIQTGRVLARLAVRYGYEQIGRSRLTNDALIAMGAARLGIEVITANERDFRRLAEFRPFRWQVI